MKTYFAISDIHGENLSPQDFYNKGFNELDDNHYIVFMGDYFDRGDYNVEVYNTIVYFKEKLKDRCIVIRGNHEDMLYNYVTDKIHQMKRGYKDFPDSLFLVIANGGEKTLKQLLEIPKAHLTPLMENLIKVENFIEDMVLMYETKDYIFTHGGLTEKLEPDFWNHLFLYGDNPTDKTVVIGHLHHNNVTGFLDIEKDKENDFLYVENNNIIDIAPARGINIAVFKEKMD